MCSNVRHYPFIGWGLCALSLLQACRKDEPLPNEAPQTQISVKEINLAGENRLNSLVTLHWWGTDADGYVSGYELSFDQQNWHYTEKQDSTFLFSISAGSDTMDVDFWVRAVDNGDAPDRSPAYLRIPLKNTPPETTLNDELCPADTAFTVVTLAWTASDRDGNGTLKGFELKINDGEWVSFQPFKTAKALRDVLCIVPMQPKASGATEATIFFDDLIQGPAISGLRLNETNSFYIRAVDIANSPGITDTLDNIFVRGQQENTLVIGANSSSSNTFYKNNLNTLGIAFDFIDFASAEGKNQPGIWFPTFTYLLGLYDQVILYANDALYENAQTKATDILLEYASTSIQHYMEAGGKLLISSALPNGFSTGSALFGILPIDSLSTSEGQARLPVDSMAVGLEGYPDLQASEFISGLDPVYPSTDADVIYTANLTKNNGWEGPDIVGVRRQQAGKTNMIFFSVELHKLNGDQIAAGQLFDKVLNGEFNW